MFGDDRLVGEQPCGLSSSAVWDYESPGFQKLLSCARGGPEGKGCCEGRGGLMHNCGFMIDHAFMRTALLAEVEETKPSRRT